MSLSVPDAGVPTPLPTLRLMGRGTLSRDLVLRVTALVAFVAIALSSLTALAAHVLLERQLDAQLTSRAAMARDGDSRGPGSGPTEVGGAGQQQGFLIFRNGVGFVQVDRERQLLSPAQTEVLARASGSRGPVSVLLPGLGSYRVSTTSNDLVIGLPNGPNNLIILSLMTAATVLTLLAIAAAFWAARAVVEGTLRPLQRLATTAHHVSQLELDSGEVNVPVRVPAADSDPRSEVGQVALAFNHMLDNVEGALAARQRSETKVRQFVADASHELRNPLASIRGYAELTRRGRLDLPAETQHALGRIESESERMSHLVEDLLLLARLDSGPALRLGKR